MSCWTIKSGKNEIIVCSVRCVLFAASKVWENGFGETMRLETKMKRNETISFCLIRPLRHKLIALLACFAIFL